MQLTDIVVSYSLQINTRCLRFLAECNAQGAGHLAAAPLAAPPTQTPPSGEPACTTESQPIFTESVLVRDSRRLHSLWMFMSPAFAPDLMVGLSGHAERIKRCGERLSGVSGARGLCLRLASAATEAEEIQAFTAVAELLPPAEAISWDALNEVFTQDSAWWRDQDAFRAAADTTVLDGLARNYRKSYRTMRDVSEWQNDGSSSGPRVELERLERWVRLTCYQLELLRPGLSDKGKAQLWYMEKLADTLRMRTHLVWLLQFLKEHNQATTLSEIGPNRQIRSQQVQVRASTLEQGGNTLSGSQVDREVAVEYVLQHVQRMNRRVPKLAEGCLGIKPKRFRMRITQAATGLGVQFKPLLPRSLETLAVTDRVSA